MNFELSVCASGRWTFQRGDGGCMVRSEGDGYDTERQLVQPA
jgi:hypothetical protein